MADAPFLMPSDPPLSRDPDPDPPPSSKRRWSPCTWRYAIEEVQPDLASKPRGNYIIPPPLAPRAAPELPKKPPSPDKVGDHCDQIPPAAHTPSEPSLKMQGHKDAEEMEDGAPKKGGLLKRFAGQKEADLSDDRMRRRKKKEGSRRRAERDGYLEDGSRRRKREMSPSELYFCEICAAKASNGSRSPEHESC